VKRNADCLRNRMSQPVLSSPFSYRLLYKTHKRLNPRSYKPFLSSRIRRKRDQHRGAGFLNLNSISPRPFPPRSPGKRTRPVITTQFTFPRGRIFGEAPGKGFGRRPHGDPFTPRVLFGTCHRVMRPRFRSPPRTARTCRASASI
jgi:hypothetical protein